LTVERYLTEWLAGLPDDLAHATRRYYHYLCHRHLIPALGRLRLRELRKAHLDALRREKEAAGLSGSTVGGMLRVLSVALGEAVREGLLPTNPVRLVRKPKAQKRRPPAISTDLAVKILDAFKLEPDRVLVSVGLALGLRSGELRGLRWSDVDFERGALTVSHQIERVAGEWRFKRPKSEAGVRTLKLPPVLIAELKQQRERVRDLRRAAHPHWLDYNLVFPTERGHPLHFSTLNHRFPRVLVAAGLPRLTPHDLRHAAVSLMLAQGIPLAVVSKLVGHSQVSLTADTYGHLTEEMRTQAADAMERVFRGLLG
jgi:integrase